VNRRCFSSSALHTVLLDRDGVLNRKLPEGEYVSAWEHFDLLSGAAEAIVKLKQAGLRVLVISNQRGIALRLYRAEDVDRIHAQLQKELETHGTQIDGLCILMTRGPVVASSRCRGSSNRLGLNFLTFSRKQA
jgi:D-glycero-D-manno-heptose 1,7-bisphosphate phosphatase